jgi:hypothetical protein
MSPRQTAKQKQAAIDRFNRAHPPGTKIRVWRGRMGDGPGVETTVEEPGAYWLGGHTPVVKVPGDSIALTHVEPV